MLDGDSEGGDGMPAAAFAPVPGVPADLYGPPPGRPAVKTAAVGTTSRRPGAKLVRGYGLVAVLFVIVPVAAGLAVLAAQSGSRSVVDSEPVPAGPPFELTGAGLRSYVAAFEDTFGATSVVRTVFYDGYVVSWVPQDKGKVALWNYRDGAFEELGDPLDDALEAAPVDLADLRPAKVMSLVRKAEETLGVAAPATTYVIYERDVISGAPQVMVYVTDGAGRSGYLIGDLDGNVLSTYGAA